LTNISKYLLTKSLFYQPSCLGLSGKELIPMTYLGNTGFDS